jgi:predicted flap endonuclease-1-like 5' DNA nuclease
MIALTWQTVLILTIAYFVGCIVGCLARKLVGARPVATTEPAVQAAAAVPAEAPTPHEVRRTVAAPMPAAAAVAPVERPVPDATPQKAFRRADHDTPEDVPPPEPTAPEPPPPSRPAPIKAVEVPPPTEVGPPVSAAEAVAAAVAERMAVPTPPLAPEPVIPAVGDDFTRIRAIDAELVAKLNDLGVTRYAEMAAWSSDDVHTVSAALGLSGRIERENWIEQAQILARGGATAYATGLLSGGLRTVATEVVPTPHERGPDVAARAAFAEPRQESLPSPPAPAKVSDRDNLQRIGGISAEIEDVLSAHDIMRYSQIAGWSAADVQRVEGLLGFSGRISRENWIEQAQILARGGATAYSRAFDELGGPPAPMAVPLASPTLAPPPAAPLPEPAPSPAAEPAVTEGRAAERVSDLSGMRSVRSEAFRAPDSMAAGPAAKADDLKRIRGIGLLIERKLNAMGVSTYEQIANWTADDVCTVNARLEFKGRIERENWIEQARILASGGQTDFSRRFERGEA